MTKLKLALALFLTTALVACGDTDQAPTDKTPGGKGDGAGDGKTQAFDGVMQKFSAEYVSPLSGRLRPGVYLAYKFELWANSLDRGTIRLFECQDASCSLRAPKYKMTCRFDLLTCRILDGNGQDVKKSGLYKADASEVGDLQIEGNCSRFTGGTYRKCAYITLVDPMLKQRGFNQHFLGADFLLENGRATELKKFHLNQ